MSTNSSHPNWFYPNNVLRSPVGGEAHGTVLYLHGGGLIFGSNTDLPPAYTALFTNAGYDMVAIGYPLAPQFRLEAILSSIEDTIGHLGNDGLLRGDRLILLGRSAGAFLALQLQARALKRNEALADRLVALYGYADMTGREFTTPSPYFQSFGTVDPLPTIPADDDFASRYSLYVGLRQRGDWPGAVLDGGDIAISDDALAVFPPTFLAASAYDPDVPFRSSKRLAKAIPRAQFYRVYDQTDHDFDRDPSGPHGLALYREIIEWLASDPE